MPPTLTATVTRALCQAALAGVIGLTRTGPVRADDPPTPVTARCYIDCEGGCRVKRGGTDAAAEDLYVPDRGAWRATTDFLGWTRPPPSALATLPDLQKTKQCPPPDDPNPEPCRLRFKFYDGLRGGDSFYNVEAGERHRVLASRTTAPEILADAKRLAELGQCPNRLAHPPVPKNGSTSGE